METPVPPKLWFPSTRLHGTTSQKNIILILNPVKASSVTLSVYLLVTKSKHKVAPVVKSQLRLTMGEWTERVKNY
jgi:hypothetical protein